MDRFYVFVNLNNPLVKNNFELSGRITSAGFKNALASPEFRNRYLSGQVNYLPYIPNPKPDMLQNSLFSMSTTDGYRIEYNAEICRQNNFSTLPSRLSCVYAFKHIEDCVKAIKLYNWPQGSIKEFFLEPNKLNRVHKANMEVISLARSFGHKSCLTVEGENDLWNHYWQGGGDCRIDSPLLGQRNSGEIWEYLIEGSLVWVEKS